MNFELVVFDLDGTLVDSLPDIASALNHALRTFAIPPLDPAVVRTLVGDGILALATRALTASGATGGPPAAELARVAQAHYHQHVCEGSLLYDGVEELLRRLKDAPGRRLAVLTNKPAGLARPLVDALGLDGLLDAVIGDGDGFPRKPAPDALIALCRRFGVPEDRTLMVGDGLPDLAIARAAGCPAAAALWGYTPRERLLAERPNFVAERPEEIRGLA
jgi:phosphoglycolate phosphatase